MAPTAQRTACENSFLEPILFIAHPAGKGAPGNISENATWIKKIENPETENILKVRNQMSFKMTAEGQREKQDGDENKRHKKTSFGDWSGSHSVDCRACGNVSSTVSVTSVLIQMGVTSSHVHVLPGDMAGSFRNQDLHAAISSACHAFSQRNFRNDPRQLFLQDWESRNPLLIKWSHHFGRHHCVDTDSPLEANSAAIHV